MEPTRAQARTRVVANQPSSCEICQGFGRRRLFAKDGYDFFSCTICGHIFLAPEQIGSNLHEIYGNGFFSDGPYADYLADKSVLQKNFERFIAILRRYSTGGSLLEVGCAHGFFLELAQRHWQVRGIDIEQSSTRFAREQLGLDVLCGDLAEVAIPENSCDVVTMWDTVEHLASPALYVQKIAHVLKPGGILALTTGDAGSVVARLRGRHWRLYYPPFHVHYFSRQTLARLMQRFGLDIVAVRSMGYYRSLDTLMCRAFFDRKASSMRSIYALAKKFSLIRLPFYLNLFDIMFVVVRKRL